jgi:hypothetical protein
MSFQATAHAKFEDAQLSRVPGNSVVLVIAQHTFRSQAPTSAMRSCIRR